MPRFSDSELRTLRNDVPVRWVIETLLELPQKEVEGVYRFLCPGCQEFQTGLNPHTNLARCFRCSRNFNPIELIMAERSLNFVQSVKLLREVYFQSTLAATRTEMPRQVEILFADDQNRSSLSRVAPPLPSEGGYILQGEPLIMKSSPRGEGRFFSERKLVAPQVLPRKFS